MGGGVSHMRMSHDIYGSLYLSYYKFSCVTHRWVITQSRSEPDFKQKTETELTLWYALPYCVHSEALQSKQQQKQVCTSHNWKCDHLWHLWPKCDQTYFAKKTEKKTEHQIRSQIQICDSLWPSQMSQIGHTFDVTGTNLFLFLFGNPARNGSHFHVWHIDESLLILMCDTHIYMWVFTHSQVWHIYQSLLILMCHTHMSHYSFSCVTHIYESLLILRCDT